MQYWSLETQEKREFFMAHVGQMILAGKKPVVKFEQPESTRTSQQNKALYLWFEMCAKAMRDAGLDLRTAIRQEVELPVTKSSFKEYIWVPLQKVMTGKESTAEPSKSDYPQIAETITRHFASTHNLVLPEWPTRFGDMEGAP